MNEQEISYKKSDYRKAGKEIYEKLHLATYPVAIKYMKREVSQSLPASKGKISICQAFTMARRWGSKMIVTAANNFCTPATVAHGWVKLSKEDFIESQVRQGWHKDVKAEKRRIEKIYMEKIKPLQEKKYIGLKCTSLLKTNVIPDTILIYGNGAQLMHIIHALTFEHIEKYTPKSYFEGYGESCLKGGLTPFVSKRPQVVIPGTGGRSLAGVSEHEIAIGIPAHLIFYVNKNMFKSGGAMNLGYPVRQIINLGLSEKLTPGFNYLKDKIEKSLKENYA